MKKGLGGLETGRNSFSSTEIKKKDMASQNRPRPKAPPLMTILGNVPPQKKKRIDRPSKEGGEEKKRKAGPKRQTILEKKTIG